MQEDRVSFPPCKNTLLVLCLRLVNLAEAAYSAKMHIHLCQETQIGPASLDSI